MDMKFGASTFIWVSPFSTDKSLDLLEKVKKMGFDILEVCIEDPETINPEKLKGAALKTGIDIVICGAFGPTRDVSSDDSGIQREGIEYIKTCIDYAAIVGSPSVIGPMYSATGKARLLTKSEKDKQWDLAVGNLKNVAEYAKQKGIVLAIEPLNRFETDFVNTVDQGLELITRIGFDNVGLLLDTFHMNIEEKKIPDALLKAGGKVFHFHACGNDRGTPGQDHIDWEGIRTALQKIEYKNPVVIESFTPEIKEIAKAVSIWRPISSGQDQLAVDGLKFLRELLG